MNNSFKSIYFIYLALTIGQFVFCMILLFMITMPDNNMLDSQEANYPYLAPLIIVLAGGAAWLMNNLRQQSLPLTANLSRKVMHYRVSVLIRSAIIEAGNLFCLILALLENSLTPVLYFSIGMAVFLYFRPQLTEFASLYRISSDEKNELEAQLKRR